jgi:hypothetical protein
MGAQLPTILSPSPSNVLARQPRPLAMVLHAMANAGKSGCTRLLDMRHHAPGDRHGPVPISSKRHGEEEVSLTTITKRNWGPALLVMESVSWVYSTVPVRTAK